MKTFREVVREVVKQGGNLNLRERVKLRAVMAICPEKLEAEILAQALAEGVVPASTTSDTEFDEINWAALAEFIKEILPAILQIISLFL